MLFSTLVETSQAVQSASARLAKIATLAGALAQLTPDEVPVGVAYLSGELPQGRIGIGYAALRDSATDAAPAAELNLLEVHATFTRIASATGSGSARERAALLRQLFARATRDEQHFIRRLIAGELRQGAQEGIMLDAIARAAGVPASAVRRALMLSSNLGEVAAAALTRGELGLALFRLQLFCPIGPMLAQTAEDPADALARLGEAAAEYKLDGARIQVHKQGEDVRLFTRGQHDVTERAPEIVELVQRLPARELILDGETIALQKNGKPQPFQITMRRFGRRLGVANMQQQLPLTPFFFDILHLDGRDVLDEPGHERYAALASAVGQSGTVPRRTVRSEAEVDAFSSEALERGHEGVMIKSLNAPYEAGRRGSSWLKLKPAHTLDLVVLAAEWGSGRRQGWLSNLHLGARDPKTGGFVMLGKTFKGLTDALLVWQTRELLDREVARDSMTVYVRPELVVEIAFDGVQQSPHYPGGVALRFARVKRYRSDKRPEEADVIDTLRAIQARTSGGGE